MTAAPEPTRIPKRTVRTRRIAFAYPTGALDHHYVQGDLVMSHVVAVLSGLFPEGEDFFIRSVRRHANQITDPELKSQVAGFIGQEVTHGREHRALNDRLREMGYPTRLVDRFTHYLMIRSDRFFPRRFQLAVTAGALLSAAAAIVVFRRLPRQAAHGTAVAGAVEAIETTAELGLAGVEPAFVGGHDKT